jgi:hypothetical protein
MIKKLSNGWIRDYSQEGYNVLRWYEKGDIIASLVKTDFPNEGEWRISGTISKSGFDSISSRGDYHLMEKKSDAENIRKIETLIRREKLRNIKK